MKSISIRDFSVQKLQMHLENGHFAVPELQREFVWNGRKAAALLDSIARRLPIGTALVWKTSGANSHLLRKQLNVLPPYDDANELIWFLIDGQQRVSVLYQIRKGDKVRNSSGNEVDFQRVVINLRAKGGEPRIVYRLGDDHNHIPLSPLLGAKWKRNLSRLSPGRRKVASQYRRQLLRYKMPLMFVESSRVEEVRECFIRINSLGTPVSAADRAFARASAFDLRHLVDHLRSGLAPGFQELSPLPVLLALALVEEDKKKEVGERAVDAMIRRLERNVERDSKERKRFLLRWKRFCRAVGKAVDYTLQNLDVPSAKLLYSDNMLALLATFFYWSGKQPNSRQRREIRKWFWATAVGQRYTGQGYRVNIGKDVEFFKRLARSGNARFRFDDLLPQSELKRVSYARPSGLASAFETLLRVRRPRYVDNGEPIPLEHYSTPANRRDRHHIFPKAQLAANGVPSREYNSVCNICFIVAEENQIIGTSRPSVYLHPLRRKRHFASAMRSHVIPYDSNSGLWDRNLVRGFRRFVSARQKLIARALEKEAGIRLFQRT